MHRRVRHLNPAQCGAQVALDARFIAGVADGAALGSWPSRAVASITANQGTASSQPTFRASSINGRPAVEFDGTGDFMSLSAGALSLTNNAQTCSVITVSGSDGFATDTLQTVILISVGGSTNERAAIQFFNTPLTRARSRRLDADAGANSGSIVAGGIAINGGRFDWAANSFTANRNGVSSSATAYASGAGNTSATNSSTVNIGAVSAGSTRLQGRIAAVVVAVPWFSLPMAKRIREHFGFSFRIATH